MCRVQVDGVGRNLDLELGDVIVPSLSRSELRITFVDSYNETPVAFSGLLSA